MNFEAITLSANQVKNLKNLDFLNSGTIFHANNS